MDGGMGNGGAARGRIELICGCMFSGKSERLIRRIRQARAAGVEVVAFKHASDDRYDPIDIVTHSGWREPAIPAASSAHVAEQARSARLIAIDEAQFFDASLAETCRSLAAEGRQIVLAGLDRDAWGRPFGAMPELTRICDAVMRTRAVCARCGAPAEFTQRIRPMQDGRLIGGCESYEPRCARCFQPPPESPPE